MNLEVGCGERVGMIQKNLSGRKEVWEKKRRVEVYEVDEDRRDEDNSDRMDKSL